MTNNIKRAISLVAKIFLILFLIFITFSVIGTFFQFAELEKKLADPEVDYEKIVKGENDDEKTLVNTTDNQGALILGDGSNYSLGSKNPKITIVEFADFSCQYCKQSFPTIREISVKYSKDIKYIFRDLPIVSENSPYLALAARCAGEQGFFWPMHDKLYINQGISTKSDIINLAKQCGVKLDKFESCFDSQKYITQIQKDYNDAEALGLEKIGTPVWYINGTQVAGDIPEETFTKIIESFIN